MKKKQRIVGRIHNSGEYGLDPKYSHKSALEPLDPNDPREVVPKS